MRRLPADCLCCLVVGGGVVTSSVEAEAAFGPHVEQASLTDRQDEQGWSFFLAWSLVDVRAMSCSCLDKIWARAFFVVCCSGQSNFLWNGVNSVVSTFFFLPGVETTTTAEWEGERQKYKNDALFSPVGSLIFFAPDLLLSKELQMRYRIWILCSRHLFLTIFKRFYHNSQWIDKVARVVLTADKIHKVAWKNTYSVHIVVVSHFQRQIVPI